MVQHQPRRCGGGRERTGQREVARLGDRARPDRRPDRRCRRDRRALEHRQRGRRGRLDGAAPHERRRTARHRDLPLRATDAERPRDRRGRGHRRSAGRRIPATGHQRTVRRHDPHARHRARIARRSGPSRLLRIDREPGIGAGDAAARRRTGGRGGALGRSPSRGRARGRFARRRRARPVRRGHLRRDQLPG